jgi:hypothetical protein
VGGTLASHSGGSNSNLGSWFIILTEVCHRFPQSLQANSGIVPAHHIKPRSLPFKPLPIQLSGWTNHPTVQSLGHWERRQINHKLIILKLTSTNKFVLFIYWCLIYLTTPFQLCELYAIAGVGNLRHACQAWHVERFSMARWMNWNTVYDLIKKWIFN